MSQDANRSDRDEQDDSEDFGHNEGMQGPSTSQHIGRKPMSGQTCSLKTLIDDNVLDAGDNVLTLEYMRTKFIGDLMPNGQIRWTETKQVFTTPSAWVNHCKRIVNPDNSGKTGSAWSTIRYNGKRLDSYKLRWYRRQKRIGPETSGTSNMHGPSSSKISSEMSLTANVLKDMQFSLPVVENDDPVKLRERNIIEHVNLPSKSLGEFDNNLMVKCTLFSSIERIQPFTMTVSTNALLHIDFHSHLTNGEVVGYLGGTWDLASHNLAVLQAFPCRSRLGDKERGASCEEEIRQNLEQRHLSLVGWYHSHPRSAPQPTIKDLESQMEYQIAMKGESDSSYVPCVGLICSPYDAYNEGLHSSCQAFWVMPPPEYRPYEFGKPMQMIYSVTRDSFLTQDLLLEMRLLAHFYMEAADAVKFTDAFKESEDGGIKTSYWEKLLESLKPNLPRDLQVVDGQSLAAAQVQQQALQAFFSFVKNLLT